MRKPRKTFLKEALKNTISLQKFTKKFTDHAPNESIQIMSIGPYNLLKNIDVYLYNNMRKLYSSINPDKKGHLIANNNKMSIMRLITIFTFF